MSRQKHIKRNWKTEAALRIILARDPAMVDQIIQEQAASLSFNEEELIQSIGKEIRRFRDTAGLSQEEVAEAIGLSCVSISNIESGKQATTFVNIYKLAFLFNCKPGDFLPDKLDQQS